ncbi:probable ATP-dependent RNA helicase DDX28 [Parasteatoda tepidariorum]|uniref:probable ATP-dependent RNA helicase DDX28 n=1 Tax=Parasteatoda tepidariorum TaxID=114398 RepID=UPI00077FCE80|nr:probable ATP-dependent RNA helicase DDX28 [Parasteatoda tepidariorum]
MLLRKSLVIILWRGYSQSTLPVPIIRVPKYVTKHVEKKKSKDLVHQQLLRRKILHRGNTSIPVISCTEGEYNHYLGQLYNDRYPLPLLSKFWYKAKTSGQKFTIRPYDTNPSVPIEYEENDPDIYCKTEFCDLNLNSTICASLKNRFMFGAPAPIQILAIPKILEGENVMLCAEAGCGKTIAYLAPLIQLISKVKQKTPVYPNTPLGLVIVPGRELAEQVADIASKLGYDSGITVKVLLSEGTFLTHLKPSRYCDVDILVTTLGSLSKLKGRVFKLSNIQHLVLDEADTLTDKSFIYDLFSVFKTLNIRSSSEKFEGKHQGAQVTFVSTIYPSNISELYTELFTEKDVVKISSNYLHRIQPHVEQKFWRVNADTYAGELLHLVKTSYQKKEPTLIFCNKSPTCDWMTIFFKDNGISCEKLHGAMNPLERSKVWQAFQEGEFDILCCTDLVSRGLDTQRVKHVINFDFPNNTSDYILRCGRVGRVGTNHGHVTNLVASKSGVYTVQDIERGVRSATRLPNVDSNIKQKIKKLYFQH